tara:strand:+ start:3734 stop:4126 length:393 start_codon:yes stop_codon:yes gene_type:complete
MHKGKKPKGMTIIIAVGGGKPPSHGRSNKNKKGSEMIKIPMEALVSDDEMGEGISPEVGDMVSLDSVEGSVAEINDDGTAHIELMSAGGVPIEYADKGSKEEPVDEEKALEDEGAELLAAAEKEDEMMDY